MRRVFWSLKSAITSGEKGIYKFVKNKQYDHSLCRLTRLCPKYSTLLTDQSSSGHQGKIEQKRETRNHRLKVLSRKNEKPAKVCDTGCSSQSQACILPQREANSGCFMFLSPFTLLCVQFLQLGKLTQASDLDLCLAILCLPNECEPLYFFSFAGLRTSASDFICGSDLFLNA